MTSTQATETYVDALRVIYDEAHTALETVRIQLREKRVDVPTLMQAVKAVNKAKKMAASDDETKDNNLLKKIALLVIVEDHYIERLTRSILSDERLTTTNYTDFWNEYNFCMYGPKYATPPPGEHMYNALQDDSKTKEDDSKTKEDDSKTKEDDSKTKEDNDNGNDDSDDNDDNDSDDDDDDDDDDYSNQIPVDPRYHFMDQFVYAQLAYKQNPSLEALNKIQTTHAKMNEEGIFMIN